MVSLREKVDVELENIWRSGNSRVCTFSLPNDPFMVRKIKPQRTQRITESCYFYLSPPLCHSVSSVVFRNFISKISKVSEVLITATRDTKDPNISTVLCELEEINAFISEKNTEECLS